MTRAIGDELDQPQQIVALLSSCAARSTKDRFDDGEMFCVRNHRRCCMFVPDTTSSTLTQSAHVVFDVQPVANLLPSP